MSVIILIILVLIAFFVWSTYNKLVTLRTRIQASIQEIGNQLKRQADLIPNLVESVKGYLKHEKEIFAELTSARKSILEATAKNDPQLMVDAGEKLQKVLGEFRVVVESTPQIRGVESVNKLMDELRDTADKVMYSRRTLIDLTADYNITLVTFPSNLVAKIFNFQPEKGLTTPVSGEHLEVSDEETKGPKVKL
ncbi:MAG: LemA family protein [Patescibacteria group bacterium]|nr:LemA family protein [Patescibacteria group bacterium]